MSESFDSDEKFFDEYSGLKVGDVVQLKSGGPDMTITQISQWKNSSVQAHCKWFVQKTKNGPFSDELEFFPPASLKKTTMNQ